MTPEDARTRMHKAVMVIGGDYTYTGELVALFTKLPRKAGADSVWRCVVQDEHGRLFIHRLEQLA